jgi:hypothetical protein
LPGPCDSPAVVILNACPKLFPDTLLLLAGSGRRRKGSRLEFYSGAPQNDLAETSGAAAPLEKR